MSASDSGHHQLLALGSQTPARSTSRPGWWLVTSPGFVAAGFQHQTLWEFNYNQGVLASNTLGFSHQIWDVMGYLTWLARGFHNHLVSPSWRTELFPVFRQKLLDDGGRSSQKNVVFGPPCGFSGDEALDMPFLLATTGLSDPNHRKFGQHQCGRLRISMRLFHWGLTI